MNTNEFLFWIALPPGADDLHMLEEVANLAEPLLDLRYCPETLRKHIVRKSMQQGLAGLTAIIDSRNKTVANFLLEILPTDSRVILTSTETQNSDVQSLFSKFKNRGIQLGVEVGDRKEAQKAVKAGADFLVASGYEAYGPVSEKTSLILIQELTEGLEIPLVIRGSLGPQGAAGAFAAGCAGCILDSQVLLADDSPLNENLKRSLRHQTPSDTTVVGSLVNHPYRFLNIGRPDHSRKLSGKEKEIFQQEGNAADKSRAFEESLKPVMDQGFTKGTEILPVGQGLAFAQLFAERELGIRDILKIYQTALRDSIATVKTIFPFRAGSHLAILNKVKYPIVQGPMAGITDNPKLAVEVANAGALPFLAAGSASPKDTRRMLAETRTALGEKPFGIGIIGFSPDEKTTAAQMEAVLAEPPDFVTIAGGDPAFAQRFEDAGIGTYLHAPTAAHTKDFLDKNVKGIILEGHEAGGHVGALGSMVLWELGVNEIVKHECDTKSSIKLLLAGGITNAHSAFIASVLASPLIRHNVALGLQIGTAYLMTDEALETGAIAPQYAQTLLGSDSTTIMGRTVNLPSQWVATEAAKEMIRTELKIEKDGLSLTERKKIVKRLSHDHMAAAAIDRQKSPEDQALAPGTYLTGQMISLQHKSRQVNDLHEELTKGAQKLAESCIVPVADTEISEDAIAIIGMGCIFPGANNPAEFWENIINRVDKAGEVPKERWDTDIHYDPDRDVPDKSYSKLGAFIKGFKKNPAKFRIPPVSAPFIDRIQFLALEVAYQALGDAGYLEKDFPKKRTGVFVGNAGGGNLRIDYGLRANYDRFTHAIESVEDFQKLPQSTKDSILEKAEKEFKQNIPEFSEDTCGGTFGSIVAGRICNCFDLGGPGIAIDGACAASLSALDQGIAALRDGRLDLVLAGGMDDHIDPATYVFFSSLGTLSQKGTFPFDERADGFVIGEGAGMLLLKRLNDALRDGDRIYATVQGIGTSSDGRVKGITAPDVNGQILALERAYENVPFSPDTVSLIEAHGTGTWVGDITEITSLTKFFRKYSSRNKFVGIGSVKSMIGHLKAASGIAGLIKATLALHNRVLPPTLHCEQPRKEVDWETSPFYLLSKSHPWEKGSFPRRAAVDSFGFGGINCHAVLEEAPSNDAQRNPIECPEYRKFPAEIFVFRSTTRNDLLQLVENKRSEIALAADPDLRRISFDLQDTMSQSGPTLAIVAKDRDALIANLTKGTKIIRDNSRSEFTSARGIYFGEVPMNPDEKVAFLFSGQGSQYVNMGGDLPEYFPFVGNIFQDVDSISRRYVENSMLPFLINDEVLSEEKNAELAELLMRPDCNHPAMLAMGVGICEVLGRTGIQPNMTAGHSLGEYLALNAAGVFSMESAAIITAIRGGSITERCFTNGAMVSVRAPTEILEGKLKEVQGFWAISNKNCPSQTVISGETEAIERIVTLLEKEGIHCKRLSVAAGFHSSLLVPAIEPFRQFLDHFEFNLPTVPVQSNLTGREYEVDEDFSSRLREILVQHMIKPVEFIKNINSMYENGARLFVEIGPGSTLCSFVDNTLGDKPHWTIPTNLSRRSATLQILHALAFCAARGLPVDIKQIIPVIQKRHALLKTTRRQVSKPSQVPSVVKTDANEIPDLVEEALADHKSSAVKEYLNRRMDFIKDMLRLDFQHFNDVKTGKALEPEPIDDNLTKLVVRLISQKTGYPPEDIDIDYDVEAELGLDSIKQVEIIRTLAKELDIDFGEDPRSKRYKISTPRKLIEIVGNLLSGKTATAVSSGTKQPDLTDRIPKEDWKTDCHRWSCELIERPLADRKDHQTLTGKHILLLASLDGPGGLLKTRLEGLGAIVTFIKPSESPEDLRKHFDIVLDMWAYGENDVSPLGESATWWKQIARRVSALLKVGQHTARSIREDGNRPSLWVDITSLGGGLGYSGIGPVPSMAGIGLGMSRCLVLESQDKLKGLYLDFDPLEPFERVADCVLNELTHKPEHFEIGFKHGKRFEIRWKVDDKGQGRKFQLNSKSVVLAIGGARGITSSICRNLAERTRARFIIVGRSPVQVADNDIPDDPVSFDTARKELLNESHANGKRIVPAELDRLAWKRVWKRERSRNISSLRNVAGKAVYRQCDITDMEDVRQLVKELLREYGRLDLVIQGGGELFEKSLEDFDSEEFVASMKSKAMGTACLLNALKDEELGAFVNLSSVSGRFGNKGQASYAAGHELASILVAGENDRRPGSWFSIYYGPWLNVGMIRLGSVMDRLRTSGSDFITENSGSDFSISEFEGNIGHSVAFFGNSQDEKASPTPFLDHIDIVDAQTAKSRRVFDLKRDRFVADHFVNYEYPILPGVVSLEMIAQTASALVSPELLLTDLEEVEFPRSGTFPRGDPREFFANVYLTSKEKDCCWFSGKVFSLTSPPSKQKPEEIVHARCRLRFGYREAPPKPSLLLVETGIGSCRNDAGPLWKTKARSERVGLYQSIRSFETVSRDGVTGEVESSLIPDFGKKPFLDNPIRLDGVLDLASLYTATYMSCSTSPLGSIKSIKFYTSNNPNEIRFCRTQILEILEKEVVFNVEAIDSQGKVAERITSAVIVTGDIHDAEVLPEAIWNSLRENPRQTKIKRILGYEDSFALAHISTSLIKGTLEADEEALLKKQLSEKEIKRYRSLKHPKRRLEWLAGRIAAKGAVRMLSGYHPLPPFGILIQSSIDNAPIVVLDGDDTHAQEPHISISHSKDMAVAVAALSQGVGVDVEKVNESILEIADEFSTNDELDIVGEHVSINKTVLLSHIWAAKEAALKSVGPHNYSAKDLVINKAEANGEYVIYEISNPDSARIKSITFQSNDYVYAVSMSLIQEGMN